MSKRIILILCIALLAVSFAAARVVNFSIAPAFSFYNGQMPINEDGTLTIKYKGYGFGFDTAFDLTFGDRAELYIEDSLTFSGKIPFGDVDPAIYESMDILTLDINSHVGFEFAFVTEPVKLSVGAGAAVEVVTIAAAEKGNREQADVIVVVNCGVGGTVKAEYQLANNWSAFFKAYADYLFVTAATGSEIPFPEGYEPQVCVGKYSNFALSASAGVILHF